MKITKTQINYLSSRLDDVAHNAMREFMKGKPVMYTEAEKSAMLERALEGSGITRSRDGWVIGYFKFPENQEHEANKAAIEAFKATVANEKQQALDAINLGDSDDAMTILAQFSSRLAELV